MGWLVFLIPAAFVALIIYAIKSCPPDMIRVRCVSCGKKNDLPERGYTKESVKKMVIPEWKSSHTCKECGASLTDPILRHPHVVKLVKGVRYNEFLDRKLEAMKIVSADDPEPACVSRIRIAEER